VSPDRSHKEGFLLWIENSDGERISPEAGGPLGLAPNAPRADATVEVPQPLPEGELTLMVRRTDGHGSHTESTEIHPPRHH